MHCLEIITCCLSFLINRDNTCPLTTTENRKCFGLVCCYTSQAATMVMWGQSDHLTKPFSWANLIYGILLTFCLLLLPLWESVIVLCFVIRYVMSILVLQSSLMWKRELVALLDLSSWCLLMVEWLFLAVPWGCLGFVIVVLPDHTHYF